MDEPLLKVEEEDQKSGSGDNSTTNEFSLSDIASQQDADSTLHDASTMPKKANIIARCGFSPTVLICISHALSAWGDRMWMYAISIFLIKLTPGSFRFTALYGLAVSLFVVAFGTLVGNWIDMTPRLKAARLTIIIQNSSVVACAVVLLVMFHQNKSSPIFLILAVVLVLLAIIARLSSLGTTIAIERDWVVVIAKENESMLAGTNSTLRRIDLTCNILAPVLTGLVLSSGSDFVGVLFIASWNVLSAFVEYTMITSVYYSCPALANKVIDANRLNDDVNVSNPDLDNIDLSVEDTKDRTGLVRDFKNSHSFFKNCAVLVKKLRSRVRVLVLGIKIFFQQRVAFAGVGLACLYLTVLGFDSITTAYAYSQHASPLTLGLLTAAGALTGIFGTFLFPIFRKIFGLDKTGLISNSIQLFFLMFCVASIWAPGHSGHLLDPHYHHHSNRHEKIQERCLNVSNSPTVRINMHSTLITSSASDFPLPSSALINMSLFPNKALSTISQIKPTRTFSSFATITKTNVTGCGNITSKNSTKTVNNEQNSIISLVLLMGGIVMSRIGLWMTDLTITQLFQENVPESERGIVSGVQNSFNSIMDVAHFVMVTVAPRPEQFSVLILISVAMVTLGLMFYCLFAWNHRSELSLTRRSSSYNPIEGASQILRDESRRNSTSSAASEILNVEKDNYSLQS